MPLQRFECPYGHMLEGLYRTYQEVPEAVTCPWHEVRAERRIGVVHTVGPVWTDLERYDQALLTPHQRRAGCTFRSGKEIARYEEHLGLQRATPAEVRESRERCLDEVSTRARVAREDGPSAELDWVDGQEIMQDVGWDDAQLRKWKESQADADAILESCPPGPPAESVHFDRPPDP